MPIPRRANLVEPVVNTIFVIIDNKRKMELQRSVKSGLALCWCWWTSHSPRGRGDPGNEDRHPGINRLHQRRQRLWPFPSRNTQTDITPYTLSSSRAQKGFLIHHLIHHLLLIPEYHSKAATYEWGSSWGCLIPSSIPIGASRESFPASPSPPFLPSFPLLLFMVNWMPHTSHVFDHLPIGSPEEAIG